MAKDKQMRDENRARQSSEQRPGFGQDPAEFGAGGQRDQNLGDQQHQDRNVDRDRKVGATGTSPRQGERR